MGGWCTHNPGAFSGLSFPSPHGLYFLLLFIRVRVFCVVSATV